jgi:hypothetical protein
MHVLVANKGTLSVDVVLLSARLIVTSAGSGCADVICPSAAGWCTIHRLRVLTVTVDLRCSGDDLLTTIQTDVSADHGLCRFQRPSVSSNTARTLMGTLPVKGHMSSNPRRSILPMPTNAPAVKRIKHLPCSSCHGKTTRKQDTTMHVI